MEDIFICNECGKGETPDQPLTRVRGGGMIHFNCIPKKENNKEEGKLAIFFITLVIGLLASMFYILK